MSDGAPLKGLTHEQVIGRTFGRLTALRVVWCERKRRRAYECRCSCEKKTIKIISRTNLLNGIATSCGCYHAECAGKRMFKHGHARSPELKTPTYINWRNIIQRVESDRPQDFPYYKAKGIKVCDRWKGPEGYQNFLSDMKERPTKQHSIDRIDPDKNYEPGNCRWATPTEQNANRSDRR